VWDYPRPPLLELTSRRLIVEYEGLVVADTTRAYRVCETASPPTYYFPLDDVDEERIEPSLGKRSFCEWKGRARYWSVRARSGIVVDAAWSYPEPSPPFAPIRDYLAFYAQKATRCTVDGELVTPQPGLFYGGWVTPDLVGPFKGEPGSEWW
jgi:uncharacterized protein (DUF427 family)